MTCWNAQQGLMHVHLALQVVQSQDITPMLKHSGCQRYWACCNNSVIPTSALHVLFCNKRASTQAGGSPVTAPCKLQVLCMMMSGMLLPSCCAATLSAAGALLITADDGRLGPGGGCEGLAQRLTRADAPGLALQLDQALCVEGVLHVTFIGSYSGPPGEVLLFEVASAYVVRYDGVVPSHADALEQHLGPVRVKQDAEGRHVLGEARHVIGGVNKPAIICEYLPSKVACDEVLPH
eukprot:CAMPEP_0202895214 /NCGR_PEP_ID=MMETSP1392-20130828/4461_1 /ASSEMBLY_ACC=CAM_ASM_000868 /TAXON_ID=225041 /ORGANISM="Chlamydomonas chlamydogama, Strain SAG 11-48b" /LENGTH=235 /DNA_ID=CAMNT_0049580147 /DNA_START=401 /DNA_END=1109 /DNA_ORIENTATION=+